MFRSNTADSRLAAHLLNRASLPVEARRSELLSFAAMAAAWLEPSGRPAPELPLDITACGIPCVSQLLVVSGCKDGAGLSALGVAVACNTERIVAQISSKLMTHSRQPDATQSAIL